MNPSQSEDPVARVQSVLQGYPEATVAAAAKFARDRDVAALDRLLRGVLVVHLPARPDPLPDPDALAGSTRLVDDLEVDSLTLVELSFLLEDVVGVRLSDDELRTIVTIDDLSCALRRRLGLAELS